MLYSPLLEKALRVAAVHHAGQSRKGSQVPYLSHPAAVAIILLQAGIDDEETLAAALLHDVVEDTEYSPEQLAADFPASVVRYVSYLTEQKRDDSGRERSWRTRKHEHIAHVADAPVEARAILLADKLHNLMTMQYDLDAGEPLWHRFNASPEQIFWYHEAMVQACKCDDPRLQRLAGECTAAIAGLIRCVAVSSGRNLRGRRRNGLE